MCLSGTMVCNTKIPKCRAHIVGSIQLIYIGYSLLSGVTLEYTYEKLQFSSTY